MANCGVWDKPLGFHNEFFGSYSGNFFLRSRSVNKPVDVFILEDGEMC
jgi:hypothetical protein